jgi:hypothetical protein
MITSRFKFTCAVSYRKGELSMRTQTICCSVGIYCRLSKEDVSSKLESMSISNQRDYLTLYVEEMG